MKKNISWIILISILIVIVMLGINNFFCTWKSSIFNEIMTPIATIAAAIIYFYSLKETRKTNEIIIENRNYEIIKNDIEETYRKLKKEIFFTIEEFKNPMINELKNSSNCIEFGHLFHELISEIKYSKSFNENIAFSCITERENPHELRNHIDLLLTIHSKISYSYKSIETIIENIVSSNLNTLQKRNLINKLISDLLVDYISLFTFYNHKGYTITFNEKTLKYSKNEIALINPLNEKEVITNFSFKGFDNVYKLLLEHKFI